MRKNFITFGLVIIGLALLLVSGLLVYREWSPQDDSAASVYYVSPNGSDSNTGTNANPWKTLTKAHATIAAGDTVILKDGVYTGYFVITKANTTWKSENKNKAILDGGFAPTLLEGDWRKVKIVWDRECEAKGKGKYSNLVDIGADNVTVDGLFLRNSCGRAILTSNGSDGAKMINNRIDWTMSAGAYVSADTHNTQFIGNEMTRISFGDTYQFMESGAYKVNISIHMSGENMIVRDNIIAWGRGEIAMTGARNLIFENNIVIGNKNNFYPGWASGVIVRNNLIWSPENQLNPGTHWEKLNGNTNDWHMSSRNEKDGRWAPYVNGLDNIAYYNNIIINNGIGFDGYHRVDTNDDGEKDLAYSTDTTRVYFGHNTVITGSEDNKIMSLTFHKPDMADADSKLTGIMEHNIFDTSKSPSATFGVSLSGNDNFTFRNNILPSNATQAGLGQDNIFTNDSGLTNPLNRIDFPIPAIGVADVDMTALRNAIDLNNFRLKQGSSGINNADILQGINETEIPDLSKSQDYFRNSRIGIPDIGAIEFGGVYHTSTPTPIQSTTPILTQTPAPSATPSVTTLPTNTNTPGISNTPTPPIVGNICGKADIDGDGRFSIADFAEFAKSYGTGKNTCADKDVDYGPCGGRDVNKDGKLNIADFGGAGIGFAQRYYPKLSCAL
jgi:hypothetical protein